MASAVGYAGLLSGLACIEAYVGVGLVSIRSYGNQDLGTRLGLLALSHLGAAYSLQPPSSVV